MISPIDGIPPPGPDLKPGATHKAAQDFEALLIAQMLRSARETSGSAEADSIMDMAEGQFSSILAANGGLGLASLISKSLEAPKPHPPTHPRE